jgi:hypothetical protein
MNDKETMTMNVPPAPVVIQPRRGPSAVNVVLALAVMVALGGVAFAAGRVTAPAATNSAVTGFPGRGGAGTGTAGTGTGAGGYGGAGFGGRAGGAGALGGGNLTLKGTVTAVAADHVTISLASGATIEVGLDGATTYHHQAAGANTDVQVGKTVQVELNGFGGFGGGGGAGGRGGGAGASPVAPAGSGATPQLGPARDITVVGQ